MIEFTRQVSELTLTFDITPADDRSLEDISFMYLVSMKFDGKFPDGKIWNAVEKETSILEFVLKFNSFENLDNAAAHCRRNLSEGAVVADYRGALDRADPNRRNAKRILRSAAPAKLKRN
ncbi:hypothetical protein FHT70_005239 [Rhizobium sp. BK049]|uniref:hypothetical protein n=1 Tax=Rhizobium sp. BK049 TaxID=2587095 RepID=UPI00160B0302|nr:hypothetical protein [Rhizobium sp. BK049]MBB3355278.1 hypothetical protein [Rhizobium sp. BK049]